MVSRRVAHRFRVSSRARASANIEVLKNTNGNGFAREAALGRS
jgi:hypothetical protein